MPCFGRRHEGLIAIGCKAAVFTLPADNPLPLPPSAGHGLVLGAPAQLLPLLAEHRPNLTRFVFRVLVIGVGELHSHVVPAAYGMADFSFQGIAIALHAYGHRILGHRAVSAVVVRA